MALTAETDTEKAGTETETFIDSESADLAIDTLFQDPALAEEEIKEETEEETEETTETEEETTEEEESTETEEETTEETTEEEKSDKWTDAQQAAFDDRFKRLEGKLRSEHKEAVADLQKEKDKLNTTPDPAIDRVRNSWSNEELDKIESDAEEMIEFVLDNPEGWSPEDFDSPDGEHKLTAKALRAKAKDARHTNKEIQSRRKLIGESERQTANMTHAFPELLIEDSEESRAVAEVFKMLPELKNRPDSIEMAIRFHLGSVALLAKPIDAKTTTKKAAGKKAPVKKAPQLGNSTQKAAITGKTAGVPKAIEEAAATGSEDAIDAWFAEKF